MSNSNASEQERDVYAKTLKSNVNDEMTTASDTSNKNISVHKNPLSETTQYLFKNDVYDIFKVVETLKINTHKFTNLQIFYVSFFLLSRLQLTWY